MEYRCFAACSFGLESVVAQELKNLHLVYVLASDARVYFTADEAGIAAGELNRANCGQDIY